MKVDFRFLFLLACFFLSGLAGLIYETAWTLRFSLVFGTSELALATVLAAYMAGLALGAGTAGRWAHRVRRPVLAYALLEIGIAVSAVAVPAAIDAASRLHVALLGSDDLPSPAAALGSAAFYLLSSFAILVVPTALMGATLPLLARWAVRREADVGPRIGVLYTANTAGAAAGTLTAAFVLLPRLGLGGTVLAAVAVNLLVFVLAALLGRGIIASAASAAPARAARPHWILPLVLISGAISFTWEILWTRLLTHVLGGSVYAFATMLATFLVGIALGSALAAHLASTRERARIGFAIAQIAAGGLSLTAFAIADQLPGLARRLAADGGVLGPGAVLGALTLLPGAVAIGATFPFAVRVLARDAADAAPASGRIFAWNTAGAIAGALAAGYLVLPALRFAGTAAVAAAASLVLALVAALASPPGRRVMAAAAVAGLLVVVVARPATPWTVLRQSHLAPRPMSGEVVHYGVGRSATVLLFEQPAEWRLTSGGLPESSILSPQGRNGRYLFARWLSLLPLLARPETRSMLVVGLGGGVTAEDVPAAVEEIRVVELEPEILAANRRVANRRARDPLADPRLRVHLGDARGALRLTGRRFDAVVSQPSHPWTSGASHLFTREFFTLVRQRLTPEGIFVQWMGLAFVDEELLRSLIATVTDVFGHVEVFQPQAGAVLLMASARPFDLAATIEPGLAAAPRSWRELGVLVPEDVFAARVLDAAGARRLGGGATPNTDSRNLLRMRSPKLLTRPRQPLRWERLLAPYDPLQAPPSNLDELYLVRSLLRQGALPRARRLAQSRPDPGTRQTALGLVELAGGRPQPAELHLRRALELDPGDEEARHALLTLYRPAIARGQPSASLAWVRSDAAAAVVEGWGPGDGGRIRHLEERLAAVGPKHPFFAAATRLRVRWRLESGDPARARQALDLLAPLLAPVPRPADLLLRARVGAAADEPWIALAAVWEALPKLGGRRALIRQARGISRSLPPLEELESWRHQLLSQLEGNPAPTRP